MKFACVLLAAMAVCLAMVTVTEASPIQMVQASSKALAARQQVVSVPAAAAASSDDDDDDDDDEDIEDALDDDDDDDDDDEPATGNQAAPASSAAASDDDDDEDDDYIERFFDDILGDEDDDDDDEVSSSSGVQTPVAAPASPATVAAVAAPTADDAIAADYPIGDASDSAVYDDEATAGAADEGIQVIDTAPGDAVKEPSVASVADTPVPVLNTNSVAASAPASASSSASDDDDDDEEDDDITDALDDDDDDEEEEVEADAEAEDDDDDEDDLIGEDVIEARARALVTSAPVDKVDPAGSAPASAVPDILINKYNRFVDGIFGRINTILKRSYDPVNVRLTTTTTAGSATAATSTNTKTTTSGTKAAKKPGHAKGAQKKRKSNKTKSHTKSRTAAASGNSTAPVAVAAPAVTPIHATRKRSNDESNDIPVGIPERFVTVSSTVDPADDTPQNRAAPVASQSLTKPKKKTVTKAKPQKATPAKLSASAVTSAPPTKSPPTKVAADSPAAAASAAVTPTKIQRARGVLYGLSTLQRQGNVRVNVIADHTTVRSNFRLGPLQLKVEKAFGRGAKRELKSATATTTEMMGRITLRIVNGAATLHSIKVQQPKQVQVVSADNHDRTREFLWKKSAHIADVVSEQLNAAARSMLLPPPGVGAEDEAGEAVEAGEAAETAPAAAALVPAPVELTKTTTVELVGKEELAHELRLEQQQQERQQ